MALKVDQKLSVREIPLFQDHMTKLPVADLDFEFPKHLRRNWLKEIDWRFFIIFLVTCLAEIGLILVASRKLKNSAQIIDTQKIQQQYAQLLLRTEAIPASSDFIADRETEKLIATITIDPIIDPAIETSVRARTDNPKISINDHNLTTTNLVPLEERVLSRSESPHLSSARAREVSETGILQYIISGNQTNYEDELSSLYTQGEINSAFLRESVSNLKLANYQPSNFNGSVINNENFQSQKNLKGSQKLASLDDELASLLPLTKINLASTEKNVQLDYGAQAQASNSKKRARDRSAEEVTRIIVSHNRAIQDCYKIASKNNPGIKGKITVRIFVDVVGHVTQVEIVESTLQDEHLLRCILGRIRRWKNFGECDPEIGTKSYRQTYVFGY